MKEHEDLCVCFHVSLHKIQKFIRLNHPKLPSQVSGCYGAGTGCGWCIPFIEKTFEAMERGEEVDLRMTREEYLERRQAYRVEGCPKNRFQ